MGTLGTVVPPLPLPFDPLPLPATPAQPDRIATRKEASSRQPFFRRFEYTIALFVGSGVDAMGFLWKQRLRPEQRQNNLFQRTEMDHGTLCQFSVLALLPAEGTIVACFAFVTLAAHAL
jgi:hypothetical protein